MKKTGINWLPAGFWVAYALLVLIIIAALFKSETLEEDQLGYAIKLIFGVAIVPSIFGFFGFYHFIFPNYFQKRKFLSSISYGLLVSLGSCVPGAIALYFLVGFVLSCYQESDYLGILIMTFIAFICGSIALIIRGFITMFEEMTLKETLQEKNHQMEMALVKAQLDPHFLFNTLNNIDVLIIKNSEEASKYLNKLSDIMRFMLFETKAEFIPLAKEIEYIEKFIELQKIRTANKSYVHFEVIGSPEQHEIAPMVLIPFIENAFKHTTNKKLEYAIEVKITVERDSIEMICKNKKDLSRSVHIESNGLGNELIKKRLLLIYPGKHSLEVKNLEDSYTVMLNIQNG